MKRGHHILFPKNAWMSQGSTRTLRQTCELIPVLHPDNHSDLHKNVGMVALLHPQQGEFIIQRFLPIQHEILPTINNLLTAAEQMNHYYRDDEILRKVGELFIESIEAQKPYIVDGLRGRNGR